jgi:hypothetical protein
MRDEMCFAMVPPAPGFTARVMRRVAERERTRTRQRALIGSVLLAGAAGAVLWITAAQLVAVLWVLMTNPRVILITVDAFRVPAFWTGKVLEALWVAATAIAENLDPLQLMLVAVMVFGLTMLWAHVVTGTFQSLQDCATARSRFALSKNHVGGLRK